MDTPRCKTVTCKKELTFLEGPKCWRCLACNPLPKVVPVVEEREKHYVDQKWTEEMIIEIIDKVVPDMIRETLENWHIRRPSVTQEDVKEITTPPEDPPEVPEKTWRERAKEMGIPLSKQDGPGARKKAEVLADIAKKEVA